MCQLKFEKEREAGGSFLFQMLNHFPKGLWVDRDHGVHLIPKIQGFTEPEQNAVD